MAITLTENLDESLRQKVGKNPSCTRVWNVAGESDENLVRLHLNVTLPTSYNGLFYENYSLDPNGAIDEWIVTVVYDKTKDKDDPQGPLDRSMQLDLGSSTANRKYSLETVGTYEASGVSAPDTENVINQQGDEILGADILVPNVSFTETHEMLITDLTDQWFKDMLDNQFKTNDATFRAFEAGEVLFAGASVNWNGEETADVTFKFMYSKNEDNLTIGDITGIVKKGWDYLWVHYKTEYDPGTKKEVKKADWCKTERVYEEMDFAAELGI